MRLLAEGYLPTLSGPPTPLRAALLVGNPGERTTYQLSPQMSRFRAFLRASTVIIICAMILLCLFSVQFFIDTNRGFSDTITSSDSYISDLIGGILEAVSIIEAIWYGWVSCSAIGLEDPNVKDKQKMKNPEGGDVGMAGASTTSINSIEQFRRERKMERLLAAAAAAGGGYDIPVGVRGRDDRAPETPLPPSRAYRGPIEVDEEESRWERDESGLTGSMLLREKQLE